MTYENLPTHQRFDATIRDLIAEVNRLSNAVVRIPVVDTDPTLYSSNLWMMTDGRLRGRRLDGTIVEYAPVVTPGASTSIPALPAPEPYFTQQQATFEATWSVTYIGDGTQKLNAGNLLYYGFDEELEGERRCKWGFNTTAIVTALNGTSIQRVELYLHNVDTFYQGGVVINLGGHNNLSAPTTYAPVEYDLAELFVEPNKEEWYVLPNVLGTRFASGDLTGFGIDQRSLLRSLSGSATGTTDVTFRPKLRVTYLG